MTFDIRPWRRLLAVWLPAVALCVVTGAFYIWQTSESGGRRAQIQDQIDEMEQEITRLEELKLVTRSDHDAVADIYRQFDLLYDETFGNLDERLTRVLRAVGSATRDAGAAPGSFSYTATDDRATKFIRFGVRFSVNAEYGQIREILAALQSSPEFLVVEDLNLAGEEDSVSRDLSISVSVATFLAEADAGQLRRLTGGISAATESGDG